MTSDFFLEEADQWREEVWDMIRQRSDVMFWIQTKRAERIAEHLPKDWDNGWENVILCVTTENQKRADERLPILLSIPAKHKTFMCAPILSEIHAEQYLATGQFEKVLADGENYDGTRPCRYEWIKSLHDQCEYANVEFDFIGTGNIFIKDGKAYRIRKRIREYRHSVRDLVIHQEIRIFQCSRNVGFVKGKTAAMAVIGVGNADKGE